MWCSIEIIATIATPVALNRGLVLRPFAPRFYPSDSLWPSVEASVTPIDGGARTAFLRNPPSEDPVSSGPGAGPPLVAPHRTRAAQRATKSVSISTRTGTLGSRAISRMWISQRGSGRVGVRHRGDANVRRRAPHSARPSRPQPTRPATTSRPRAPCGRCPRVPPPHRSRRSGRPQPARSSTAPLSTYQSVAFLARLHRVALRAARALVYGGPAVRLTPPRGPRPSRGAHPGHGACRAWW
jgi:hypothetical protein